MYFKDLPKSTQNLVRELMADTIEQVEGWKGTDETFEDIECKARSGFIPFSHNKGGLTSNQFTDLCSLWGSGSRVSHKEARTEIERQIEYSLKCAQESYFENNKNECLEIGLSHSDMVSYHVLYDNGFEDMAQDFCNYETESMSGDESSIMFQVRFLYHGIENGIHRASVSCAVNTEGPYHRSSIAWAPEVFCEGAKEIEITWKTESGLKTKLTNALKKTSGEVF